MDPDYSVLVYVLIATILLLKLFGGSCGGGTCS